MKARILKWARARESLKADTWEAGAADKFTNFTPALREYAIAGVLHFQHFAALRDSMEYELVKRRGTNELARALSEPSAVVAKGLDRLLRQHTVEWSAFIDNLGPRSFVRQWIDGAS